MHAELKAEIVGLLDGWRENGLPGRDGYLQTAQVLERFRCEHLKVPAWKVAPRLLTATFDDAWGHGLEVIEALAVAAGLTVLRIGLQQRAATVAAACRRRRADLLGVTVLQLDTDELLVQLRRQLPATTRIVAGGPVFRFDSEMARRTGIDTVCAHGADFLRFLTTYSLKDRAASGDAG